MRPAWDIWSSAAAGAETSLLCGTVEFDRGEAHPVFSMLPPLIHVRDADGSMLRVVESLIELIAAEVDGAVPGAETVVARLTDVLIIYVLRDYISRMPSGEVGLVGSIARPRDTRGARPHACPPRGSMDRR